MTLGRSSRFGCVLFTCISGMLTRALSASEGQANSTNADPENAADSAAPLPPACSPTTRCTPPGLMASRPKRCRSCGGGTQGPNWKSLHHVSSTLSSRLDDQPAEPLRSCGGSTGAANQHACINHVS